MWCNSCWNSTFGVSESGTRGGLAGRAARFARWGWHRGLLGAVDLQSLTAPAAVVMDWYQAAQGVLEAG